MLVEGPIEGVRTLAARRLAADVAVVGGGIAGTCFAIAAARGGAKVVLIQDRPVLGGNASSEVRLWALGATAHMSSNSRWALESGIMGEILAENMYRNPEGNAHLVDAVLLDKVAAEPNITLLLDTALFDATKSDPDTIASVKAFCSQNSTLYEVDAPLFCDASGDGILGFLAGAAFRMGAESRDEFGEPLAPPKAFGELLGHSIYFFSKDVGRPVAYMPPTYAHKDIPKLIPRYKNFRADDQGCRLWWIEYGGRLDTVHETEAIKWELWRIVYGVWDYIKNSGEFPEAENLTLEWVGTIPGKRESRRFEGDAMLTQSDVVEQRSHADDVAFGGWALDLHPADGIYSELGGCTHWYMKGVYPIPYRCLYSRNIKNLFLAGRIISASHVAFGTTRVMATLGYAAQAAGTAAALCARRNMQPRALSRGDDLASLQRELMRAGQHIPGRALDDPDDLARAARITASSTLRLRELPPSGPLKRVERSVAQLLPVNAGAMPKVTITVDADAPTVLMAELRASGKLGNFTPDVTLAAQEVKLGAGRDQSVTLDFDARIDSSQYVFIVVQKNPAISVRLSDQRLTGVLCVQFNHAQDTKSAAYSRDIWDVDDIGAESFELWTPERRPAGQNLALRIEPPLDSFAPSSAVNGIARPTTAPNAWLADLGDRLPTLTLRWTEPLQIGTIALGFDTDFDHAKETVLWGHPERVAPFCVKRYRIRDGRGALVHEEPDNHETLQVLRLATPLTTDALSIELVESHGLVPKALLEVRCYGPGVL